MEVNEEPSQFVTGDGNQQETMISSDTRDLNLPKANVQKDEVIENSKTETTDTSGGKEFTPPANEKPMRICLIGELGNDDELLNISKLFNVPVEVSETGDELLADTSWLTYFVLKNFDGTIFDKLVQQKQKILGPGALRHAATKGDGVLPKISRPRYNYAMAGCVTSFSGIKQRDILTHLIHLVHSMGGSVRKDMGTNVTHLICNSSSGKKYAYAVTFRLSVVHPSWVYNAWENRDIVEFNAMVEPVIGPHKVKVFDGLKVCFFGFPPEESEHMVDVLKQYGGIATDIEDPDCSHVILSNNGGSFQDHMPLSLSQESSPKTPPQSPKAYSNPLSTVHETTEVTINSATVVSIDGQSNMEYQNNFIGTPKTSRPFADGAVLAIENNTPMENPLNISPIASDTNDEKIIDDRFDCSAIFTGRQDEDDVLSNGLKRKRDSLDNISILSTDSLAPNVGSVKKPKLLRTGSISRGIRKSMSFVAHKTPISNMLRSRRSSVDPNASISSINSMDSTIHETSTHKPFKERFRGLTKRITRSSKKESSDTPKSTKMLSNSILESPFIVEENQQRDIVDCTSVQIEEVGVVNTPVSFKTPKIPHRSITRLRHSVCGGTPKNHPITDNRSSTVTAVEANDVNMEEKEVEKVVEHPKSTTEPDNTMVVDEQAVHSRLDMKDSRTHIVRADWFWYSIQNGYADEEEFKFADYLDSIATTPCKDRRDSFPMSLHKRKRKRLSQKSTADAVTLSAGKRRSSVSDAGLLSVSGSFLDCTASPDRHDTPGKLNAVTEEPSVAEPTPKAKSMRFNHFMDLFTTETNYVNILDTIVNLFKEPLEKMADSPDELLNKSEIRGIFNNFIPIYDVHKRMLNSLKTIHQNWSDDALIGQIIIDNRDELIKAYPPYVNFFEQMKEMLIQCDQQKPRFHAFLKINQAKPECGRQTLQDLMIRPVQRLPSVTLILNDIIKYTSKSNPDLQKLEESLKAIREVMTYINEDKRKTEGQLAMFDIFNDIDNCPPQLVSSHRSFVSKCEVTELSHSLAKRGDTLVLFLFNDTIEVCKKRSRRGFNNAQTPPTSTTSINTLNSTNMQQKSYKHIKLMPLSSVQEVVDITDSPQAFAINCKSQQENKDKIFAFSICDEVDKTVYLKNLCKQMAENACRADGDKFMVYLESQDLAIDINSVNLGTLSSMFKFASRTRWKVGRALSFNKTPGKIKRAVSTVMTSPYDNLMTPTTQLEQMKLASCTNISEMGKGEDDADGLNHVQLRDGVMGIQRPMSVQPTRRNKTNTMPNSLRRI